MAALNKLFNDNEIECLVCHNMIVTTTLEMHMFCEHDNDVFTNMAGIAWHKHKRIQELQTELDELNMKEYDCEIKVEVIKARIHELQSFFENIAYKSFVNPFKGHDYDESCCCDSCNR